MADQVLEKTMGLGAIGNMLPNLVGGLTGGDGGGQAGATGGANPLGGIVDTFTGGGAGGKADAGGKANAGGASGGKKKGGGILGKILKMAMKFIGPMLAPLMEKIGPMLSGLMGGGGGAAPTTKADGTPMSEQEKAGAQEIKSKLTSYAMKTGKLGKAPLLKSADKDGDGSMNLQELTDLLTAAGVGGTSGVPVATYAAGMMQNLDKSGDQKISQAEFEAAP